MQNHSFGARFGGNFGFITSIASPNLTDLYRKKNMNSVLLESKLCQNDTKSESHQVDLASQKKWKITLKKSFWYQRVKLLEDYKWKEPCFDGSLTDLAEPKDSLIYQYLVASHFMGFEEYFLIWA